MDKQAFDICIIGGGINGTGIARDAAGRGYKTLLLEKNDLASATSSQSTKLIHGGLRYLEQYQFGLVRKSLLERDVLMNLAPHIITPMRFILPHVKSIRPFWMIRIGVFLYDLLAGKTSLPKSKKRLITNKFLKNQFQVGIEYSDCWVEDSRLVVLNAMDAMAHGATIKPQTECTSITNHGDEWVITTKGGEAFHAQMVINAAGPWAGKMIDGVEGSKKKPLRLVKGSHMVIPKLYNESESYILQNTDGRIVFTIPYEGDYTLVGTTDIDIGHDPDLKPELGNDEKKYLKDIVKTYFKKSIRDIDIIATYSGVRPLADDEKGDARKASRDYELDMQHIGGLPMLNVLGGKLTTYRVLAEQVVDKIDREFHKNPQHWTAQEKLPGGDIDDNNLTRFIDEQTVLYPFLSKDLIKRYAMTYGTCMAIILDGVKSLSDMGDDIGGGLYGREVDYLRAYEFATTAEDILWRRTKLGLHLDQDSINALEIYLKERS